MAAGVPVISTDLPTGVPWVNQHGVTGLVVPPGDPAALSGAITRLLSDADLRSRMGGNARRRAETVFDRRQMVSAFKRVVESVASAGSRSVPALAVGAAAG
jgi:rhamnosyl/mannosyltransferase